MGMGPMTGRAAGFCAGNAMPGFINPSAGQGCGTGFRRGGGFGGGGRGWRNMYYATGLPGWARQGAYMAPHQMPDPEMEKLALKNQADILQAQLDSVRKRLAETETGAEA